MDEKEMFKKLGDLYAFARQQLDQQGLKAWRFDWDNAKKRYGRCDYDERTISISLPLARLNDEQRTRETILHEVAHAAVGKGVHHGPAWKRKCLELGGTGRTRYDATRVVMPKLKFAAVCSCSPGVVIGQRVRAPRPNTKYTHATCGAEVKFLPQ